MWSNTTHYIFKASSTPFLIGLSTQCYHKICLHIGTGSTWYTILWPWNNSIPLQNISIELLKYLLSSTTQLTLAHIVGLLWTGIITLDHNLIDSRIDQHSKFTALCCLAHSTPPMCRSVPLRFILFLEITLWASSSVYSLLIDRDMEEW